MSANNGYDPYNHMPAEWMRYVKQWSASEIAAMKANSGAPWRDARYVLSNVPHRWNLWP